MRRSNLLEAASQEPLRWSEARAGARFIVVAVLGAVDRITASGVTIHGAGTPMNGGNPAYLRFAKANPTAKLPPE